MIGIPRVVIASGTTMAVLAEDMFASPVADPRFLE